MTRRTNNDQEDYQYDHHDERRGDDVAQQVSWVQTQKSKQPKWLEDDNWQDWDDRE